MSISEGDVERNAESNQDDVTQNHKDDDVVEYVPNDRHQRTRKSERLKIV